MHYVYILHSLSLDQFYVGMSKFTAKREWQHRKGQSHWTSRADDWVRVWQTAVENASEARGLEKRIKSRDTRRFFTGTGAVPAYASAEEVVPAGQWPHAGVKSSFLESV